MKRKFLSPDAGLEPMLQVLSERAVSAQLDVLQLQPALGTDHAENPAPSTGAEGLAAVTAPATLEGGGGDTPSDVPPPGELWKRLESYHARLSAWSSALTTFSDEGTRQREVLDQRQRAHEENSRMLQRALNKLASDRAALPDAETLKHRLLRTGELLQFEKRLSAQLETKVSQLRIDLEAARREASLQDSRARIDLGAARREASLQESRALAATMKADLSEHKRRAWQLTAKQAKVELATAKAVLDRRVLLNIQSVELLRELMSHHSDGLRGVIGYQLVTCGDGPWNVQTLDDALTAVGFEPHLLDHAAHSVPVFIVGREGVDLELLREQLAQRYASGDSFWLFSQELFVLSLLSGEDLLRGVRAPEEHLVPEFAEDHPVVSQFLEGDDWQWPDMTPRDNGEDGDMFIDAGPSPLAYFGYHVGVRSEPAPSRRKLLQSFWDAADLGAYFQTHHDAEYRRRWGSARSGRRLTRMVARSRPRRTGPRISTGSRRHWHPESGHAGAGRRYDELRATLACASCAPRA